jgi:hypothetical protein
VLRNRWLPLMSHRLIRLTPMRELSLSRSATTCYLRYRIGGFVGRTECRTGKVVLRASATAPVSYDNPGEQQRFANARALKDAQSRAAQEISDTIKSRLASFFVAGT